MRNKETAAVRQKPGTHEQKADKQTSSKQTADKQKTAQDIDEYIAACPEELRERLQKIRATIKKAAPLAEEKISYRIPAFALHGDLIYFAAFKKHISLYPAPRTADEFRAELAAYAGGKGTLQFPLDKPIPFELISRIVKFRLSENLQRAAARAKKK